MPSTCAKKSTVRDDLLNADWFGAKVKMNNEKMCCKPKVMNTVHYNTKIYTDFSKANTGPGKCLTLSVMTNTFKTTVSL